MKITFTNKEECLRYLKDKQCSIGQEILKKRNGNNLDFTEEAALMVLNNKAVDTLDQIRIVETYAATQWEFEE